MEIKKSNRTKLLALCLAAAAGVATFEMHVRAEGEKAVSHFKAPSEHALAGVIAEMTSAVGNWWAALSPEEQAKAGFAFDDENRFDWHFIPRERKGLKYKEMTSAQRVLADAMLASGLSTRAYVQAETIRSLEQILKDSEAGPPKTPYRDPENYSYSVFGKPSDKTWGWRVEGHHFHASFTIIDGKTVVGGPVFLGTNPAEVREGPRKGLRILAAEDDLGHELVRSLSDDQKKKAVVADKAPKEIFTTVTRKANPGAPIGIPFSELNPSQQKLLVELVDYYAHRVRTVMAADDLAKIDQAGWDKIFFAWEGGLADGQGHYYRIHGPTFLIEFDDVQNDANHVHSIWRDANNDFGADLLKEHYTKTPH